MKKAAFGILLVVMVACPVWGWLPDAGANGVGKTGPRPGEKNPVTANRASLFCDDELLMLVGYPGAHKVGYTSLVPSKADLTEWSTEAHTHTFLDSEYGLVNNNAPSWAAASGRITNALHDQVVYAFFRPDGRVEVEIFDYPDRLANYVTLDGTTDTDQSVDVAAGDLDLVVDDKEYHHDEIVVARTSGKSVYVDVLDLNLNILASASVPAGFQAQKVAVAIGDFNGDGNVEFATGQMAPKHGYQIDVFRFTRDGNPSLEKVSTYTSDWFLDDPGGFDIAAGDFNGDRKDDIAVAYYVNFDVLAADDDLNLHMKNMSPICVAIGVEVSIVSGLFKFDPSALGNGYGIARRQLAICLRTGPPFEATENIAFIGIYAIKDNWDTDYLGNYYFIGSSKRLHQTSLTAGNFIGHDSESGSPLMDLAFSYVATNGVSTPKLKIFGLRDGTDGTLKEIYTWAGQGTGPMAIAAVAYDKDGDTYRLGPPAHMVIENLIGLDYVIQEPPKHVDYLPKNPDDPEDEWNWDVINVSAWPEFYVEFKDKQEETVATETKDTSSMSIGECTETDVGGTVSAGFGGIFEASVSADINKKVSQDYKDSESTYNSDYHSRSVSYTSKTNEDDYLHGKIQLMDIWRYPIYALTTDDGVHRFQDIILPGPEVPFGSGGRTHADWYQPIHQNRNVLSYPDLQSGEWLPSDLGSFKLPDGTKVTGIMNEGAIRVWDGNEQDIEVKWTKDAGFGSAKSYEHTLSESKDIKIGATAKASFFKAGAEVHTSVKTSFHNKNSWGGNNSEDATNSESTGVHIHIADGTGSEQAYAFKSAIYVSSGGGMFKVAHATNPVGSDLGAAWWRSQYGRKPDPALNLPNRFEWHQDAYIGYWTLVEEDRRKRTRGFFLRDSEKDPVSGEYDLLGEILTDGDVVRVCARVYNFSLFKPTGELDLRFEYVPFDTEESKEIGDRVFIGDASIGLNPLEMQEIYVDWDTTGLSNPEKPNIGYRLYVTLDPDNKIDEIHEWKDTQGNLLAHGNNEGYWPWAGGIIIAKKETEATNGLSEIDISMHDVSMAIKTSSGLESIGPASLTVGEHYMLRAHIVSNGRHPHYRHALFYDGDPDQGGELIASKVVRGVIEGDNYVWAEWTPKKPGNYEPRVVVLEDSDDPNPGNNSDTLEVEVVEAGDSWFQRVIREME
jgi:hypothetical protein